MAHIRVSIITNGKSTLDWHTNEMPEFMCAVTIRAMASAVEKPVVEAVLDSVIARMIQEQSVSKGLKKAEMSRATFYRRLKNAS